MLGKLGELGMAQRRCSLLISGRQRVPTPCRCWRWSRRWLWPSGPPRPRQARSPRGWWRSRCWSARRSPTPVGRSSLGDPGLADRFGICASAWTMVWPALGQSTVHFPPPSSVRGPGIEEILTDQADGCHRSTQSYAGQLSLRPCELCWPFPFRAESWWPPNAVTFGRGYHRARLVGSGTFCIAVPVSFAIKDLE